MTRLVAFLSALVVALWAQLAMSERQAAQIAAAALQEAHLALSEAQSARDRIAALTRAVHAYEDGLAALRSALRDAKLQEQALRAQLAEEEVQTAKLLGALQSVSRAPAPASLLHPGGPTAAARAGMLSVDVAPLLDARAARLRENVTGLQELQSLQSRAIADLQVGLRGLQSARDALNTAMDTRAPLPQRFVEDPIRTAILIASTESLAEFANGLPQLVPNLAPQPELDISAEQGRLPWPARGRLVAQAGTTPREGVVLATAPQALVTAPVGATIRFSGPLLDLGQVVILEPQDGLLIILAGLAQVYGQAGQVVPAATPIGLMGGAAQKNDDLPSRDGDEAGKMGLERLYIEIREDNVPLDPQIWFRGHEDG